MYGWASLLILAFFLLKTDYLSQMRYLLNNLHQMDNLS